jgi:hypothetical protein
MEKGSAEARAELAVLFMDELLGSVETILGISQTHGIATVVNLFYLQNAIFKGSYIEEYPQTSKVLELVSDLPSGAIWKEYVHLIEDEFLIPLNGASMRVVEDAEFCKSCGNITRNETFNGYVCKPCVTESSGLELQVDGA